MMNSIITNTINNKIKMELNNINNQLKLKNLELQIEKDYKKKQKLRDDIQVLQFKKQVEVIKDKIKRITR